MRHRTVGVLMIALALLMGFIIFSFNSAMTDIVNASCSHGPSCPMWGTIDFQTNLSLGIMIAVIAIAVYLIVSDRSNKDSRTNNKGKTKKDRKDLKVDEVKIMDLIDMKEGSIFQSELVDESGFSKVKVTRILDRLEGRDLIQRRRRGMTNVVILR